jgi:hypothetical protein
MNPQGDDKELKAAFAEFKELLRRESEPVGPTFAPEIRLEPRASADTPPRHQDKQHSSGGGMTEAWAALRAAPPQPPETEDGDEAVYEALSKPILGADSEQMRRRRLLYLSVAIICAGLAGLGGALVKNSGAAPEPAIADIAPPEAGTEQASLEQPASAGEDDAAPATVETPAPAKKAEVEPAAEAPATKPAAAAATLPLPGAPPVEDAPAAAKANVAPQRLATPAAPAASGSSQTTPKTSTAALQPATRAVEPAAPAPAEPKPASKVAKPKLKPAAPQTVAKPQKPATASPPPAAIADKVEPPPPPIPAPAPVAPPPPPPPSDNGGAFGFVKRTVNTVGSTVTSVGSTIGDLGRSVIP